MKWFLHSKNTDGLSVCHMNLGVSPFPASSNILTSVLLVTLGAANKGSQPACGSVTFPAPRIARWLALGSGHLVRNHVKPVSSTTCSAITLINSLQKKIRPAGRLWKTLRYFLWYLLIWMSWSGPVSNVDLLCQDGEGQHSDLHNEVLQRNLQFGIVLASKHVTLSHF